MKERKVKWVSLKELRELAVSAEVEKFDPPAMHKTAMFNNKYIPKPASKTQQSGLTVGAVELRDPKKKDIPAAQSQYQCGICGMRNHLTTMCLHKKKEGCWRCGGKHMLKECRVSFPSHGTSGNRNK